MLLYNFPLRTNTMYTNCTYASIKPLNHGYGFIATAKTFKVKYTSANAERVYRFISAANKKYISVFHTKKGYVWLAFIAHPNEQVWQELEYMRTLFANEEMQAKAKKKRAIADKKLREAEQLERMLPPFFDDLLPF